MPPHTWNATALPEGLTFASRGYLSGTPKAEFGGEITFTVTDSRNETAQERITLVIKRGMSEALVSKVYKSAFDEQFEALKAGRNVDAAKTYDDAARANGFKDYKDFCEQGARWDSTRFGNAVKRAVEGYTKRVTEWQRKQAEEGGGQGPPGSKKRVAYYRIHQPDVNYPNDHVIIWKDPSRENRAFILSPGTRVDVIETIDGDKFGSRHIMYRIRTADGRTGWVPKPWCKQVYR
jgi:hypothetical protein